MWIFIKFALASTSTLLVYLFMRLFLQQKIAGFNLVSNAQQNHINRLINNHEQIRLMYHDFKQQVDVLYHLCNKKQYDELLGHLSKLSNYHSTFLIVKTGNIMLDAVLSSKKEDAIRQGIDFTFNLNVKPELTYMCMEICILLGNAIDNAIEACVRSCLDKKIIEMDLVADSSRFLLHIKNTVGIVPQVKGKFLKTQKGDNLRHGIGLKSIKQISNKLGGDMTYEYNDNQFNIWIYLPIM